MLVNLVPNEKETKSNSKTKILAMTEKWKKAFKRIRKG